MENTFDSTYVINKDKYNEFLSEVEALAIAAYTIPAFTSLELYKIVNMDKDIAMRVVWKPDATVGQIKKFDEIWFLRKYS